MISISLFIGMSLAVLVTVSLNSVIASQRFDTFSIDTKLSGEKNFMGDYVLPKDSIKLGNETRICPSNDCKIILDKSEVNRFSDPEPDFKNMYLGVDFRLQDNKTNGHFTPKKQALVEQMSLSLSCDVQDIQEDMKNGTTKYICNESSWGGFSRNFNHTSYNYKGNMTFELPSRHLIVHGFGQS